MELDIKKLGDAVSVYILYIVSQLPSVGQCAEAGLIAMKIWPWSSHNALQEEIYLTLFWFWYKGWTKSKD